MQIEFVSANPTGPIHVGNGWFASYGDSLGRVLERVRLRGAAASTTSTTPAGRSGQLGASVLARRKGEPVPEDGYPSAFVKGLASAYDGPDDVAAAGRWAAEQILGFIRHQMESVNIHYDEWYSQASIEDSEAVGRDHRAARADRASSSRRTAPPGCDTGDFGDPREKRVLTQVPDRAATTRTWPVTSPTTATSSSSAASTA